MRPSSPGIVAGTEGPDGLHGIAPGASILPVRVGGWQPNSEGGYSVYSRTDQILAGLEAAVDPNDDGDTHDAARIALDRNGRAVRGLRGRSAPARNRRGSRARHADDRPGRERRECRDRLRQHRRAGRRRVRDHGRQPRTGASLTPTVRVHVRAGPAGPRTRRPASRRGSEQDRDRGRRSGRPPDSRARDRALFSDGGMSVVAGPARARFRAARSRTRRSRRRPPRARLPCSWTARSRPARSASTSRPGARRRARRRGRRDARADRRRGFRSRSRSAPSRSPATRPARRGLLLARARARRQLKPSLAAPGVSVPTSEPGRGDDGDVRFGTISGTSAAAAVTAGVAAVLAQGTAGARRARAPRRARRLRAAGRPRPDRLRSRLVDLRRRSSRRRRRAVAALVRSRRAGRSRARAPHHERLDAPARRLDRDTAIAPKGVEITVDPQRVRIRPGRSADVVVSANTSQLSSEAGAATGELVLRTAHRPRCTSRGPSPSRSRRPRLAHQDPDDRNARVRRDPRGALVRRRLGDRDAGPAGAAVELLEVELWRGERASGCSRGAASSCPAATRSGSRAEGRREPGSARDLHDPPARVPGDGTRKQVDTIPYRVR